MKRKFLLLLSTPLLIFSCNKAPTSYLQLFDSATIYFFNADYQRADATFQYNDKHYLAKFDAQLYDTSEKLVGSINGSIDYNDHDYLTKFLILKDKSEIVNISCAYEYDTNNNITNFAINGFAPSLSLNRKEIMTYDDLNRVSKWEHYDEQYNNELNKIGEYRFEYTNDNKIFTTGIFYLMSSGQLKLENKLSNEFDEKTRLTTTNIYDDKDVLENKIAFNFNEDDCLTKINFYKIEGGYPCLEKSFASDYYKNNPLKPSYTYLDGDLIIGEYDEYDRIIHQKFYITISETSRLIEVTYHYDSLIPA